MKSIRFTNDQLNERVLEVIKNAQPTPDKRITKEILCVRVFGYCDDGVDRKVRDAVMELRDKGEPIGTVSGMAGYYYGWDYIEGTIAEYRSRGVKEFETASILERGLREYRENKLREQITKKQPTNAPVQLRMI